MKKILLITITVLLVSCEAKQDLSLYNTNKEVAQKMLMSYTSPTNFELFKSLIHEEIEHQSPMYGVGKIGYDKVLIDAEFYMTNFKDVTFEDAIWLPGVDETTLTPDGSVRVYGTWKGVSIATGKSFSLDSYHYFNAKEGKVYESGDFFDASGMMIAVAADEAVVAEEAAE
tara:strand:+ start:125 stop:637 length:513 start_codon:yes stop_codon:yes gene_type:complete